jgi:hypothetical protein
MAQIVSSSSRGRIVGPFCTSYPPAAAGYSLDVRLPCASVPKVQRLTGIAGRQGCYMRTANPGEAREPSDLPSISTAESERDANESGSEQHHTRWLRYALRWCCAPRPSRETGCRTGVHGCNLRGKEPSGSVQFCELVGVREATRPANRKRHTIRVAESRLGRTLV